MALTLEELKALAETAQNTATPQTRITEQARNEWSRFDSAVIIAESSLESFLKEKNVADRPILDALNALSPEDRAEAIPRIQNVINTRNDALPSHKPLLEADVVMLRTNIDYYQKADIVSRNPDATEADKESAAAMKNEALANLSKGKKFLNYDLPRFNERYNGDATTQEEIMHHYDIMFLENNVLTRDPDLDTLPNGTEVKYPNDLPNVPFFEARGRGGRE